VMTVRAILIALLLCSLGSSASAELYNEEMVCRAPSDELSATEYLRSLSLDLRGSLPTEEEYDAVLNENFVPDALIADFLASDEFLDMAVRFHKALLWPNLDGLRLVNRNMELRKENSTGLYYRYYAGQRYRGDRVPCRDIEEPDPTLQTIVKVAMEDGTMREGYVWRESYWNPGEEIKVCAYDAQAMEFSENGTLCRSRSGASKDDCGCGPDLIWCAYKNEGLFREALETDLDHRVREIIGSERPYLDLLTDTSMHVNGPLVHYFRHIAEANTSFSMMPFAVSKDYLPQMDYNDTETWNAVSLPDHQAGVLTSPAFLLRFQTNRSRANQFWTKFVCEPFQPPPGGLPEAKDGEALDPDLQSRGGCKFCHAILEPAASYWGRWPESGTGYLSQEEYPAFDPACEKCALVGGCSSHCSNNYIVKALAPKEEAYFGWLKSYLYQHDAHMANVEEGPSLLVKRIAHDERLPNCMAHRAVQWLWGRNIAESEFDVLSEFSRSFMMEGYNFKELVKAVVTSPTYRRVR
jgi:hypothetical protein